MSVSLKRLTGLRGFFTKVSSLVSYGPPGYQLTEDHRQAIVEVFNSWPQLARVNYNDQQFDLPGAFTALISPIISNLTKLSLVRAGVCQLTQSVVCHENIVIFQHMQWDDIIYCHNRPERSISGFVTYDRSYPRGISVLFLFSVTELATSQDCRRQKVSKVFCPFSPPLIPRDNIRVLVIVWRLTENIIRTALCWIVWHNVHSQQHTYMSSSYRSNR